MHRRYLLISVVLALCAAARGAAGSEAVAPGVASAELEAEAEAFISKKDDVITIKTDTGGVLESEDMDSFAACGNFRLTWGNTVLTADSAIGSKSKQEVYVEGNVRMVTPTREICCDRAFINWSSGEAVFTELEYRSREKTKDLAWFVATPLGVRLANGTLVARRATLSTCDYAVPHHYLRMRELIIKPNKDVVARGITYFVHGVPTPFYLPVMIVPHSRPTFDASAGNSSQFGTYATLDVTFDLPFSFDATGTASLGYFSKRGTGYGFGVDYAGSMFTRGEAEYYTLPHDDGEDFSGQILGTTYRYRYKWLHSMDWPGRWEFDVELQKFSDAGFRKEFFEREYYDDKELENRIYVKRSSDNWAAFVEGKLRLNEYLDQTERLPLAGIRGFSQPLTHGLLWTSDTEFGFLKRRLSEIRRRPGETTASFNARRRKWNAFQDFLPITPAEELGEDRTVFRFDTLHEISRPFTLNRLKLEPFVGARGTYYSRKLASDENAWRGQLFHGARASIRLERFFDVTSKALDIDGLRHVIVPDVMYIAKTDTWGADADELIQFDEVDAIRQEDRIALRLHNRFETRRRRGIVDLFELDLETDYYPHSARDNAGESFSPLRIGVRSLPVEGVQVFAAADYDFSEEDRGLDFLNVAARVDVSERWSACIGHTYDRGIDSFGTYSLAFRLTPKWTAVLTHERSWSKGESLGEQLELIRDFHAFDLSITIENDERSGEKSVGLKLSPRAIRVPPRPASFVRELIEARDESE